MSCCVSTRTGWGARRSCSVCSNSPTTQVTWYHRDVAARRQRDAFAAARAAIGEAYEFVSRTWQPGDRILVFGAGRGGYHAHALTRLLGTVGVLRRDVERSRRLRPERVRPAAHAENAVRLVARASDDRSSSTARPTSRCPSRSSARGRPCGRRAFPTCPPKPPPTSTTARHALAIERGPRHRQIVPVTTDGVEAVWFRGGHCDIAGGPGACEALTGIAVDWVLDGARASGARVRDEALCTTPVPGHADALAGSVHGVPWRRPPVDASGARQHRGVPAGPPGVLAAAAVPRRLGRRGLDLAG